MTHVALRIVNNVSYVTRISHDSHFSWQAQYLVSLDYDTCCSAHCKQRFIHMVRGSVMTVILGGRRSIR